MYVCMYVCMYVIMHVICLRYTEQVQKYWLRKVICYNPVWFLHTTVVPNLFGIAVTLLKMDTHLTEMIPVRLIDSHFVCRCFSAKKGEYLDSLHAPWPLPRSVRFSLKHKVTMQQVSLNTVSKTFANMPWKQFIRLGILTATIAYDIIFLYLALQTSAENETSKRYLASPF
jgi:hypothetical protein